MESFWKLKIVRKSHQLVLTIYRLTDKFPESERFGLISQMRRAVVSIVANIVEATKRKTLKDKRNFHNIAEGSLEELKYYLILAYDLNLITKSEGEKAMNLCREVGAMLYSFNKNLKV